MPPPRAPCMATTPFPGGVSSPWLGQPRDDIPVASPMSRSKNVAAPPTKEPEAGWMTFTPNAPNPLKSGFLAFGGLQLTLNHDKLEIRRRSDYLPAGRAIPTNEERNGYTAA